MFLATWEPWDFFGPCLSCYRTKKIAEAWKNFFRRSSPPNKVLNFLLGSAALFSAFNRSKLPATFSASPRLPVHSWQEFLFFWKITQWVSTCSCLVVRITWDQKNSKISNIVLVSFKSFSFFARHFAAFLRDPSGLFLWALMLHVHCALKLCMWQKASRVFLFPASFKKPPPPGKEGTGELCKMPTFGTVLILRRSREY